MNKNISLRFAGKKRQYTESSVDRVTLCCVTSLNHQLSEMALLRSKQGLTFAKTLFISDCPPQDKSIDFVEIPKIQNIESYNHFILHELYKYIETDFVLLVQYDGFIINPHLWSSRFLDYDYIGARWPWYTDNTVGNGGFSIRSKRLLSSTAKIVHNDLLIAEDDLICRKNRNFLESEYGIIFAPAQIADQFSLEFVDSNKASFGFHGLHRLHYAYGLKDLGEVLNLLETKIFKNSPILIWLNQLHQEGVKGTHISSLASKIREHQPDPLLEANCHKHNFNPQHIKQILQEHTPDYNHQKNSFLCTVINYNAPDLNLIKTCLKSVEHFSDETIVTYSDYFSNGEPQNQILINEFIALNPKVHFIKIPYSFGHYKNNRHWENHKRTEAFKSIKNKKFDWLLVMNANEIADNAFTSLIKILSTIPYDSIQFKSYCYDQELTWQSNQYNDTAVLIKNSSQLSSHFLNNSLNDRLGLLFGKSAPDFHIVGENGPLPLFHQYNYNHDNLSIASSSIPKVDFVKEHLHFIIVAPSYTQNSAGIMVLHELTDCLVTLGYKASLLLMTGTGYLVSESPDHFGPNLKRTPLPEAGQREIVNNIINEGIVIYPEIVSGNPLRAPRVVRYFLNKDGLISGVKSYAQAKDFCLAYYKSFKPNANDLLCLPITSECFNDLNTKSAMERNYDVTYIGKGHQYSAVFIVTGTTEVTRNWPVSKTELAALLKGARYFYSWDTVSSTNIDALRCGAIPVFLQWNQISKEEIDKDEYGPYPYLLADIQGDKIVVQNNHADFLKKRESYLAVFDQKTKIKLTEVERVAKNICRFFESIQN